MRGDRKDRQTDRRQDLRAPTPIRSHRDFEDYERPRRAPGGPEARRNPTPPRKTMQKPKDPKSKKARRVILTVTVLFMAGLTALLAIFLLFKIAKIEITGDRVYEEFRILDICGYEKGDNLVFLTTRDKEQELMEQLPYINEVTISRHLPDTLEIRITGAQVVSCVAKGDTWLYASARGKILEHREAPKPGVMQTVGMLPLEGDPGQNVRVEDEGVQNAYNEIVGKLTELGTIQKFTKLDLTDPYDIRLVYDGRVELKLGGAASLDYKLAFGCSLVTDPQQIGERETGVLDLSYAQDVKRANFTAGPIAGEASPQPGAPGESPESKPESSPESTPENSPETEEKPAYDRDQGIPDTPFTRD